MDTGEWMWAAWARTNGSQYKKPQKVYLHDYTYTDNTWFHSNGNDSVGGEGVIVHSWGGLVTFASTNKTKVEAFIAASNAFALSLKRKLGFEEIGEK